MLSKLFACVKDIAEYQEEGVTEIIVSSSYIHGMIPKSHLLPHNCLAICSILFPLLLCSIPGVWVNQFLCPAVLGCQVLAYPPSMGFRLVIDKPLALSLGHP